MSSHPTDISQPDESDHDDSREPEAQVERSRASAALPRVLIDTSSIATNTSAADLPTGAVWKLDVPERDLDSNIIALAPGGSIDAHAGPELDVLIHVLAGSGQLITEVHTMELTPGALLWLPRRSRRQFIAGTEGLRYFTVHQRKPGLTIRASE